MTQVYELLEREGPQPASRIGGGPPPSDRQRGVCRFSLKHADPGDIRRKGRTSPIWYIEGEHDPETVLRVWLRQNPEARKRVGDASLHHRFSRWGKAWKQASRELLGPFESYSDRGGLTDDKPWECPLCGDELTSNGRADHLEGHA